MTDPVFSTVEEERAYRLAAIKGYRFQFAVKYDDQAQITDAYALSRYQHAAAALLRGHILGDVPVGAMEDAERALSMVQEMLDPINRAFNLHEKPSMRLIRAGAVLVPALDALRDGDDEIPGPTLNALAHSLLCESCNPNRIGLAILIALGALHEP